MRTTAGITASDWEHYLRWNDAVAEVIYPIGSEALPSYMDLEEAELCSIAELAGHAGGEPAKALAEAVRAVTVDKNGNFRLARLDASTKLWARKKDKQPPPCVAFLAVTVLAAEDMGDSEEDLAPTAYYARLARMLGLPDNDTALRRRYRARTEYLWRSLNTWLEDLNGERGLPTAYALAHRYVGLPMSQALVREGDRRKFPLMFAQFGLSPGMQIAPEDLIGYLENWLTTEDSPAPANLRRLWRRTTSHERIAAVAAVELANWDGVIEGAAPTTATTLTSRAVVVANLRTGFMNSSLDISLGLRPLRADMNGQMEVRASDGSWLPITFSPGTAGLWRTAHTQTVDFRSMLEGMVRIRHADDDGGTEYKHFPRTVIPLVYDELQSAFVESERLQLGVDSVLLVHGVAQTQVKTAVVNTVQTVLEEAARPGFQRVDQLDGVPEGWVLFTGVQLFAAPSNTSLNELVPLARNQLTIAGGLRIPSRIRKWSTLNPPEVRATVQSESNLRVVLTDAASEQVICEWTSHTGVLVGCLRGIELADGDYQVALFTGSRTNPVQQASIKLRSSENVDVLWPSAPRLTYGLSQPLGAISASSTQDEIYVDGLVATGESHVAPTVAASSEITWAAEQLGRVPNTIQIGTPDPKSCIVTGAHYIELPPYLGGHAPKFIDGVCKYCGLVKRFPGWLPRNPWQGKKKGTIAPAVVVHDLAAVEEQAGPDWDAAVDALMHLGGGPISSLESIALQLEGSSLFVDNFVRRLEALGHIAVERSPDDGWRPTRWKISSSCLAQRSDGTYRLTGFWPLRLRDEISKKASELGGQVVSQSAADGPTTISVTDINIEDVALLTNDDDSVSVANDAGLRILQTLPRLSAVAEALPRTVMPGFQSAERFDVASASWHPSGDLASPGAYRLRRGFETKYVYRSRADVERGIAAVAPVRLCKHLAANTSGISLAGYGARSRTLLLPNGCDLPGLYGRAVVAMSGRLPARKKVTVKDRKRTCLVYPHVNADAADLLVTLLTT